MKIYKNIIFVTLGLAILIGGFVFVNNLPDKGTETNTPPKNQTEYIDVFKAESKNIKKIDVSLPDDNYSVINTGAKPSLSDASDIKVSSQKLQSFINSCAYIYAEKIISENSEDAEIYGLTNPEKTLTIHLNDGTTKNVLIGNETIDGQGSYIKLSDDNKIYIKNFYGISSLAPEYSSFIDTTMLKFNPTEYNSLSYFNLSKSGNKDIELKASKVKDGDKLVNEWKMTKPTYADANTLVFSENILNNLDGFSAVGVIDARPTDLNKYGLLSPYATLTIKTDSVSQKFVFGKEVDGYRFFRVDDYVSVYMAKEESLSFLNVTYLDLMSRLIHLENVKHIKTIDIKTQEKDYTLKISGEDRFINGKKVDKDKFTDIYKGIISISFDSVDENAKKTGNSDVTIKYTRTDGTTSTVSFESVTDRTYLALVDGKENSLVSKTKVKEALTSIDKAIK